MRTLDDWLTYQTQIHPRAIALGLDRVRCVAARLGLKPLARQVVTVAGTNGKGSTVAFIDAMARAAGYHVGCYSSPHLLRYNERVRINGEPIADQLLVAAFERIEAAREAVPLTYFEFGTLAAALLFADLSLDLAVLEVGLGGRLDAVNLFEPAVAVVTTVALDHMDYLGGDTDAIGREKAGVFRPDRPAVIGEIDPPASVLAYARQIGARLKRRGHEFDLSCDRGEMWRYQERDFNLELPTPALPGSHQINNVATAIAALRELRSQLDIPDAAFAAGAATATLAGRLQQVASRPVLLLDVAHNPQAATVLARWLAENPVAGHTHAVFAALGDKDIAGMVTPLAPLIACWHLVGLHDAPGRALAVTELAARVRTACPAASLQIHADVATGLTAARAGANERVDRVVVFGSFHTVADALRAVATQGGNA